MDCFLLGSVFPIALWCKALTKVLDRTWAVVQLDGEVSQMIITQKIWFHQKNISVYQVVICLLDSIIQFSNKWGQCNMIIMKYWAISTSSWLTNWTLNEKGWLKDLAGVNVLCSNILFWKSSYVILSVSSDSCHGKASG